MRPILSRLAPACLLLTLFACAPPPDVRQGPVPGEASASKAAATERPTPARAPPGREQPCFDTTTDTPRRIADCARLGADGAVVAAVRASALAQRGNLLDDGGNFEAAIVSYDQALRLDPDRADILYDRGIALSRQSRDQDALANFNAAIRLEPHHVMALVNRCRVYRRLGQAERAIADCDAAIAIDPNRAIAYYQRGSAKAAAGRPRADWLPDFQAASRDPQLAKGLETVLDPTPLRAVAATGAPRQPQIVQAGGVVSAKGMTVRLPGGEAWSGSVVAMPKGGNLTELERHLPNGNREQVHVADYVDPSVIAPMDRVLGRGGIGDAERLERWLLAARPALIGDDAVRSEWVNLNRAPQRAGAACRELHQTRTERGTDGVDYLWRDWMLICIDPVSRMPVQADYAERYRADGAVPGQDFERRAGAFFDAIAFAAGR